MTTRVLLYEDTMTSDGVTHRWWRILVQGVDRDTARRLLREAAREVNLTCRTAVGGVTDPGSQPARGLIGCRSHPGDTDLMNRWGYLGGQDDLVLPHAEAVARLAGCESLSI